MKASEVLRRYKAGERNFQRVNLRGQSFKGQDLSGADFSEADIRGTNFTNANLREAKFCGARCGLQVWWAIFLVILTWLLAGILGFCLSITATFVSPVFSSDLKNQFEAWLSSDLKNQIAAWLSSDLKNQIAAWFSLIVLSVLFCIFIFIPVIRAKKTEAEAREATLATLALVVVVGVVAVREVAAEGVVPVFIKIVTAVVAVVRGGGAEVVVVVVVVAILLLAAIFTAALAATAGGVVAVVGAAGGVVAVAVAEGVLSRFAAAVILIFAAAVVFFGCMLLVLKGDVSSNLYKDKTSEDIILFAIAIAAIGSTTFQGADLTDAKFTGAKLKSTDLRKATLTRVRWYGAKMLDGVLYGDTYLKDTQLRQWLIGKGTDKNFNHKFLRGINLQGAILTDASFIGSDLGEANLSETTLTGACIEDWNINSQTKLDDVICDYIYLKEDNKERRPSDPNRNFEPGEFAKLVETSIETVDLIFNKGIDWKAFLSSYQDIQVEYGQENVSIQAIEKKSDGAFVIRLNVPPEVDKAEIESYAKQSYKTRLKVLEADNHRLLQHNASLENIVNTLASRPIIVEAKAVASSESQGDSIKFENSTVGVGVNKGEVKAEKIAGTIHEAQKQTLAEAADEIQKLLQQLESSNPTATVEQQQAYVDAAMPKTLKDRLVSALKAAGDTAIEEFLQRPGVKVVASGVKGWMLPD